MSSPFEHKTKKEQNYNIENMVDNGLNYNIKNIIKIWLKMGISDLYVTQFHTT